MAKEPSIALDASIKSKATSKAPISDKASAIEEPV